MSKGRVEAFSDGVIAVAITLLALNLHVPTRANPARSRTDLASQWPHYAAYVVSFVTIGIIWINHHAMLRRLRAVDHSFLMFNLTLLMTIVLLPFTTALMAEYLKASHGQNLAAAIYAGSLLLMSIAFFSLQQYLLRRKTAPARRACHAGAPPLGASPQHQRACRRTRSRPLRSDREPVRHACDLRSDRGLLRRAPHHLRRQLVGAGPPAARRDEGGR